MLSRPRLWPVPARVPLAGLLSSSHLPAPRKTRVSRAALLPGGKEIWWEGVGASEGRWGEMEGMGLMDGGGVRILNL